MNDRNGEGHFGHFPLLPKTTDSSGKPWGQLLAIELGKFEMFLEYDETTDPPENAVARADVAKIIEAQKIELVELDGGN